MSMLAERRTKKKWCLNPNGKDWSNDDSKFGQRMLEKMGWKKGCGLGVNLQGMKEHVRVSAKNDTKGLGCKNNSDTEWIHHQQNFENLLSQLACSTYEEIKPPATSETKLVSLEEKSKKSRVRVHYQKFTRGKDVARYSASDLACIFGKKYNSLDSKSVDMQYSCHVNTRSISDSEAGMMSDEHNVEQSLNLYKEKATDETLPSLLPKHSTKDKPMVYSHEDEGVPEKQNDILKEISNMEENSVAESVEKIRNKKKKKHVNYSENEQEVVTETMVSSSQKEMSNMEENSVTVVECKSEVLDISASHSSGESLEKIRSKRKKKRVKDLENKEEVVRKTMTSSPQDEMNASDTVVQKKKNVILKEISNMEENLVAVVDLVEESKSEIESSEKIRSKRKRKHVKDSKNNQEVVAGTIASSSQNEVNDSDTVVQEKQNGILKEISNIEENSVPVVNLVEECETAMLDTSASHSLAESLENIKSKRKRKHVKDSEKNQEIITETIASSPQDEVNVCDIVVHEVEEDEKKKKKKKKDKKYKVKVDNGIGKEDNKMLIEEVIEVISDSEDTGNKDTENVGLINEACTSSKIKIKKTGELYQTNIPEAHKEYPEMKKRKKKKMCSQTLNESDAVGDITSEIISSLPPDNKAGINNMQESRSFTSEQFSSYEKDSHQYDNKAVKRRKKHRRESTEFGFRGSNLHSISGYGSL